MSKEFSSITGLPDKLDIDGDLTRVDQHASVHTDERRYGKTITIRDGVDDSTTDVSKLAPELKSQLATGGTVSEGKITSLLS